MYSQAGGLKEPHYLQTIYKQDGELLMSMQRGEGLKKGLEEAMQELMDTKGQVEGLQRRLEEATRELRASKGREEGLQIRLEEATRELRASKGREEGLQRRLEEATEELNHRRVQHQVVQRPDVSSLQLEDVNKQLMTEFTKPLETLSASCDEHEDAEKQLEFAATCLLSDTRKEPVEVCFTVNTCICTYAPLNCEWTCAVYMYVCSTVLCLGCTQHQFPNGTASVHYHKILDSSQQPGISSDKRTWSDVAPHNTDSEL